MMTRRVQDELELLRSFYPDLEYQEWNGQHWVRIPRFSLPEGWTHAVAEVAFHVPAEAGQPPYGFWVRPAIALSVGPPVNNCTVGAATPWGTDWMQFSWSPVSWQPKAKIRAGDNMLNFVLSILDRLSQLS
jgi:hypothetical protein